MRRGRPAVSDRACRLGLVNTMVFTHIPSSHLLMTVAYAPSFPVAASLFLLREALVDTDFGNVGNGIGERVTPTPPERAERPSGGGGGSRSFRQD